MHARTTRLIVPRCRLNTYGRRAFPVAGPTVWNSLQPDELRYPACDVDSFKQFFKTILFRSYYSVTSALEVIFNVMRSINPRFTYLLTILPVVGLSVRPHLHCRPIHDGLLSKLHCMVDSYNSAYMRAWFIVHSTSRSRDTGFITF